MESWESEYGRLSTGANGMPPAAQFAAYERCVQLADAAQAIEKSFLARVLLMTAAQGYGRLDIGIVALLWCLARCDEDPQRFKEQRVLYALRWMAHVARHFPQIPKERLWALAEELRVRLPRTGNNLSSYYAVRLGIEEELELDVAQTKQVLAELGPETIFARCKACDANEEIWNETDDVKRVAQVDAVLAAGMRCHNVPLWIYPKATLSALRVGREKDAALWAARGVKLSMKDSEAFYAIHHYLTFYAHAGRVTAGLCLLERSWSIGQTKGTPRHVLEYLHGARLMLRRACEENAPDVTLPTGVTSCKALKVQLDAMCRDLSDKFDARNGTTSYDRDYRALEIEPWVNP